MALLFADGFDHYTTLAELTSKWGAASNLTVNTTGGREGGGAANFPYSNSYSMTRLLGGPKNEVILGFALKPSATLSTRPSVYLYNEVNNLQGYLVGGASEELIFKNAATATIATGTTPIIQNQWNYIELRFIAHDTTGVIQTRVNGVLDIDFTGDTRYLTYPVDIASVSFKMQYLTSLVDDVYICDETGTTNNAFLGDVRVVSILPDGDSANDFTATGAGTTNADRVDEALNDGDTTYVESTTVAHQERYTYAALPADVDVVFAVQPVPYVKKTNVSGSRSIRSLAYSVATEAVGATVGVSADYRYYSQIFEQDPNATAAWTPATVNAASFGIEIVT